MIPVVRRSRIFKIKSGRGKCKLLRCKRLSSKAEALSPVPLSRSKEPYLFGDSFFSLTSPMLIPLPVRKMQRGMQFAFQPLGPMQGAANGIAGGQQPQPGTNPMVSPSLLPLFIESILFVV